MTLRTPPRSMFTGYYGRRPRLYLTCGAPGCGKTTWALAWLANDPHTRARVNRDATRDTNGCLPMGDQLQEDIVTIGCSAQVSGYLGAGLDVVVDDTLSHLRTLNVFRQLAIRLNVPITIVDFTNVPVNVCVQRDLDRKRKGGRYVGEEVIYGLAGRCDTLMRQGAAEFETVTAGTL